MADTLQERAAGAEMKTIKLGTLEEIGRQWNGASPTKQPFLERVAEVIKKKISIYTQTSWTGEKPTSRNSIVGIDQAASEVINLVLAELPEDVTMLVANRKKDAGYIDGLMDMKAEIRRRLK